MIHYLLDLCFSLSISGQSVFKNYFKFIKNLRLDRYSLFLIKNISNYVLKYNRYPSYDFFLDFVERLNELENVKKYEVKNYNESYEFYYNRFKEKVKEHYKNQIIEGIQKGSDNDIEYYLMQYQNLRNSLNDFNSNDIFLKRDFESFKEDFIKRRDSYDEDLIPTGLKVIDDFMGGISQSDFVLFVSRPQSFKTWILCYLATNFARIIHGGKILFFSKEMSKLQIQKRIYSILGSVNYSLLKRYLLSNSQLENLYKSISEKLNSEIIIIGKELDVDYDPLYVKTKIMEYNPDVVLIDGLYLFAKTDEWENHSKISRTFRDIALSLNVPIIGTLQFSRKGFGRGTVAFSDSYEQDASCFIGIEREEKERAFQNSAELTVLKARDGRVDMKSRIEIDFSNSFFEERLLTDAGYDVYAALSDMENSISESDENSIQNRSKMAGFQRNIDQKVMSKSFGFSQYTLFKLKDTLLSYISQKYIFDIKKEEIKEILSYDLSSMVEISDGNDSSKGALSTNKSDRFYYFQIGNILFRLYYSSVDKQSYLSYYFINPIYTINVSDGFNYNFSINNFTLKMIHLFIRKTTLYFLKGIKGFRRSFINKYYLNYNGDYYDDDIFRMWNNYLKNVFIYQDPITNLILMLNGNIDLNFEHIRNSFNKSLLKQKAKLGYLSKDFQMFAYDMFYTLDIFGKHLHLRNNLYIELGRIKTDFNRSFEVLNLLSFDLRFKNSFITTSLDYGLDFEKDFVENDLSTKEIENNVAINRSDNYNKKNYGVEFGTSNRVVDNDLDLSVPIDSGTSFSKKSQNLNKKEKIVPIQMVDM